MYKPHNIYNATRSQTPLEAPEKAWPLVVGGGGASAQRTLGGETSASTTLQRSFFTLESSCTTTGGSGFRDEDDPWGDGEVLLRGEVRMADGRLVRQWRRGRKLGSGGSGVCFVVEEAGPREECSFLSSSTRKITCSAAFYPMFAWQPLYV